MKLLSYLGTMASIVGSFVVASQIYLLGYTLFLIGSGCWLAVAVARKDGSLMLLNGTFLMANLWGLYVAIA